MVQEVSNRKDLLADGPHASPNVSQRLPDKTVEEKNNEPESFANEVKKQELEQALSRVREVFQQAAPRLEFSIDPDLDRVVVKVMNGDSGEVIRQIPQQEVIELAKSLESPTGLLLHHKA